MKDSITEQRFLRDCKDHRMIVIRDDGVNRHIRFRRPDSSSYWFDLITWPGSLCIDGDMGTYVFRRLNDMFEFFRADREYLIGRGREIPINLGYWSEKLQAPRSMDVEEFSPEKFKANVMESFEEWAKEEEPDAEVDGGDAVRHFAALKKQLFTEIDEQVLSMAHDGEIRAFDAATEFVPSDREFKFRFRDVWEWRCKEYKFHFVWCCYAISWGIMQYDKATDKRESECNATTDER